MRRKLIMKYLVEINEYGKEVFKKVTLKVRPWLTDDQLRELVAMYSSMTSNVLVETVVVDERDLDITDNDILLGRDEEMVSKEVDRDIPQENNETSSVKVGATALEKEAEIVSSEEEDTALPENEIVLTEENEPTVQGKTEVNPIKEEMPVLRGNPKGNSEKDGTVLPDKSGCISSKGEGTISPGKYGTIPKKKEEIVQDKSEASQVKEGGPIANKAKGDGMVLFHKYGTIPIEEDEIIGLNERERFSINGEDDDWISAGEESLGKFLSEETIENPLKGSGVPPKQFVKPIKKKKMRPPMENKSKSSKKKKRKLR